jgi:HEAT repeat protein
MDSFKKFLSSNDQEIAETAALSYGILAAPEGVPTLRELFEDKEPGRKLVGKTEIPWRTRTFACYGLGLTGAHTNDRDLRNQIQDWLISFLKDSKRSDTRDLRAAAVISLGLVPDPDRKAMHALEKFFEENRKREEIICAHVPNAIARILKDAAVDERKAYCDKLIAELNEKAKSGDNNIRRSMAQALGMLTKAEDPQAKKAFEVLQDKIEKELSKNVQLAYFGLIALGQIAGTDDPGPANTIETYLYEKAMAEGGRVMTRSWAAIALGVESFDQVTRNKLPDAKGIDGRNRLAERMRDIKDPEQRAAFAIGLGLMRHMPAADALKKCLDDVKDDTYRGYFATGLGLMGDTSSIEKIQTIMKGATRRPELLRETAIALGLLGDKSVLTPLLTVLGEKGNPLAVQAAVATALGYVGDYRAIKDLRAMLGKSENTAESRAFAAVALGIVCDKEEYPWNFKISTDLNYTATTETLNDQGTQTGLLNLL